MDYERGSDSDVGGQPSESETPEGTQPEASNSGDESSATAEPTPTDDALSSDDRGSESGSDFGTDADVMNDAFSTSPAPPEWPAADLDTGSADDSESSESGTQAAGDAIAATYAVANDDTDQDLGSDLGDDSDAPILEDAAAAAAAAVAGQIRAESVNVTQTGVQSIEASTVNVNQGGAAQVRAESMNIEQGGVGIARVGSLTLGAGSSAFAVVADDAKVEQGSNAFLVVSRSFSGDVQPTVDWRAALAFGAGLGLVLSVFRRRR